MTDIHAAAERLRRFKAGEDPLAIWPEMRESVACELGGSQTPNDPLVRYYGTERFVAAEYETIGEAILQDPTQLLKPPVWFQLQCGDYGFRTPWGTYWVNKSGDGWSAAVSLNGLIPVSRYEETAEAAQAACWQDYCGRMKGAFINVSNSGEER